jgi:uroporphyrin-3 C-methyltransferase
MTTDSGQTPLTARTEPGPAEAPGSGKSARPVPAVLALFSLIALIAVGVSGFAYYEMTRIKAELEAARMERERLTGMQTAIDAMRADYARYNQAIAELGTGQESLLQEMSALDRRARQVSFDWLLAEVEYLLIIANQRLTLDNDVTVALAALQAADTRLRDFNDPRLLPTRRQIKADINSLQAVTPVDISGLALYLIDIAGRADKLPLKPSPEATPAAAESAPDDGTRTDAPIWRRLLNEMLDTLMGLVRVQHHDGGVPVTLSPEQHYHIHQNLNLQLETATRAVLRRETQNFHAAVDVIQDWLREHFDARDPAVDNIIVSLERMASIELRPALPSVDSSMETLRAVIRETEAPQPPPSEEPGVPAQ